MPRHGPSSSRTCASPSLWSMPGRWRATAFGLALSSVCPGRPTGHPRQAATARVSGGAALPHMGHELADFMRYMYQVHAAIPAIAAHA